MRLSEPLKACNVCAFHFILNKRGALRSEGAVTPPGPGVGQRLLVQAHGGGRGVAQLAKLPSEQACTIPDPARLCTCAQQRAQGIAAHCVASNGKFNDPCKEHSMLPTA